MAGSASKFVPPLFSAGDAHDRAYQNLRDEVSEDARICKEFCLRLWATFYPHADDHFLIEIRRDFFARFWEMYLTCSLLEHASHHGFKVSCPKPGPDVLLEWQGERIWIEAISATDGDPSRPDSVLPPEIGRTTSTVPEEKLVLRYTNAIDTKHKKYLEYRQNGIVGLDEPYVVAVNGYALSYRWSDPEIPRILKTVFPIGALQVYLDRRSGEIVGTGHQFRPSIEKKNKKTVSTQIFVRDDYCGISGVLHSYANAYMWKPPLGVDYWLVHNPKASNPIPIGRIPSAREYQATEKDDDYAVTCLEGSLSAAIAAASQAT